MPQLVSTRSHLCEGDCVRDVSTPVMSGKKAEELKKRSLYYFVSQVAQ